MLNIAICENSIKNLKSIEESILRILFDECEFNIDLFNRSNDLIKAFENKCEYDLIFLDTQLEFLNGIQAAANIRNNNFTTEIVLIADDDSYALEGYKYRIFDYLLKPIPMSKLAELFSRYFYYHSRSDDYFLYKSGSKIERIKINSILYFCSAGRIISAVTAVGKIEFYSKLDDIEKSLKSRDFVRIHQSFLVNMNCVKKIDHSEVILDNKLSLPISRNRQKDVRERFLSV